MEVKETFERRGRQLGFSKGPLARRRTEEGGPPLPHGWRCFYDDLSGQWYYVEMDTQRSTWVRPPPEGPILPTIHQRGHRTAAEHGGQFRPSKLKVPDPKRMSVAAVPPIGPNFPDRGAEATALVPRAVRERFGIPAVPARVQPGAETATFGAEAFGYDEEEDGAWVEALDDTLGSTYWWNEQTGETAYEDPRASTAAARAAAEGAGAYAPYEPSEDTSFRHRSRWVNLPPPVPLVPVHRPAWDDRDFWALCGGDAERAQRYNAFWCACRDGDLKAVKKWAEDKERKKRKKQAERTGGGGGGGGGLAPLPDPASLTAPLNVAAQVPLGWDPERGGFRRGACPLHLACEGGHTHVLKWLLSQPQPPPPPARCAGDAAAGAVAAGGRRGRSSGGGGGGGRRNGRRGHAASTMVLSRTAPPLPGAAAGALTLRAPMRSSVAGSGGGFHGGGAHGGEAGGPKGEEEDEPLDVVVLDGFGRTPLMVAAEQLQKKMVTLLLQHDPSPRHVEAKDERGARAFHYACQEGQLDLAKLLLNKGHACPSTPDDRGVTPLLVAARRGQVAVVQWLLHLGGDGGDGGGGPGGGGNGGNGGGGTARPESGGGSGGGAGGWRPAPVAWDECDLSGQSLFMVACGNGDLELVKFLADTASYRILHPDTKAPVDPDDPATFPANAKLIAAQRNQGGSDAAAAAALGIPRPQLLQALPPECLVNTYDADTEGGRPLVPKWQRVHLDRADASGRTALGLAAAHGHAPVVQLLLAQRGRDGRSGQRALWLVDVHGGNGGCLGRRPLDAADLAGHKDLKKLINDVSKQRAAEDLERRKAIIAGGTNGKAKPTAL